MYSSCLHIKASGLKFLNCLVSRILGVVFNVLNGINYTMVRYADVHNTVVNYFGGFVCIKVVN